VCVSVTVFEENRSYTVCPEFLPWCSIAFL